MDAKTALGIVQRLLEAAELFAQHNPQPREMRQAWSVWWTLVPEADALFRQSVDDIVRANPQQLSHVDTAPTLTYRTDPSLSYLALGYPHVDRAALEAALLQVVLDLVNARKSRRLQFIVENIVVDGEVPRFFGVELVDPTADEVQAIHDDPLISSPRTNALGLANVDAPGDRTTAYEWAIRQVERFLNLMQGCSAELVFGNFYPIHVIDRNPVVENTVVRERTGGVFQTSLRIGCRPGKLHSARVCKDLLSLMSLVHLERLVSATTEESTTETLAAVAASLETLGEACKPNLASTRMLLASAALEMLVGARASDDVSFRGQTAAIAERATFLAGGQTVRERQDFDRRVRALYGKGSGVRHGSRPEISTDEIVELASITRKVALALLERPDLQSRQELDSWVHLMRYTTEPSPISQT